MLSLGQTPLLTLPHRSYSDFPRRLCLVCPNPLGEATGFCLPCRVYCFLSASACFLLVSFCCSLPLTWVTLGRSPSGVSLPQCGSLRGVPLYGRECIQPRTPLSPAPSSTASPAPHLQEHHLSLKAATCFLKHAWARAPRAPQMGRSFWQVMGHFHVFQRWLGLALDSSWPPSTLVIHPLLPNPCHLCPMHRVPLQAVLSPL